MESLIINRYVKAGVAEFYTNKKTDRFQIRPLWNIQYDDMMFFTIYVLIGQFFLIKYSFFRNCNYKFVFVKNVRVQRISKRLLSILEIISN